MIRPTAALCLAALTSIGLAFDTGYALCPVQGEPAQLSIVEPPRAADEKRETDLHIVREHPMQQGCLVSPFLPEHPTREQARAAKLPPTQTPSKSAAPLQATLPAKEPEMRLVGVVSSDAGRRAILFAEKRQILLAPGDEKDGVALISLTENAAVVSTPAGERTLFLSSGLAKQDDLEVGYERAAAR